MSGLNSNILTGPEENYDIPKGSLGKNIFDQLKRRDPADIVNIDAVTGDTLTCAQLLEDSIKLTAILKMFHVQRGDVVAIVAEKTINYCIPVVAALYMGVTLNPLNTGYTAGELKHGLNLSKPKLILCSKEFLETVLKVTEELGFVESVLLMESRSETNPEIQSIQKLLQETAAIENFAPDEFDCHQDVYILLSSGTTGLPKGVLLTHGNVRQVVGYLKHTNYGNMSSKDTIVHVLPFFHIFGLFYQLISIAISMKLILIQKFKPDIFLKSIQDHKVTKICMVPPLLLFLVKSPLVENYDLSSLKDIIVGAAPVGKELHNESKKRFKNVTIRQLYGLTETGGACTFQTMDFVKPGSSGILVPGIIAKVWNSENNEIVGPHHIGELCFKGPMVMKGYVGNEEATKSCIDKDGFYHTGDVGYYDEDKYFYIVERIKELIKYKGFQVPPAELEALIISHPGVKDCGVIGIPDERAGQLPLAFVVKQDGSSVTEAEIVDYVAERISVQKRLYGGVRFVEELPKNPSGKVLRRKLLELYKTLQ